MNVYYNEIDPYCVQWLRNLIDAGHVPAGTVDDRRIEEVSPEDLRGYSQCHFFAGIGGWVYALSRAGWGDRPVWTASLPCQPYSEAGKLLEDRDERALLPELLRLVAARKPATVFGEQVASAAGRRFVARVRDSFGDLRYDTAAAVLSAASAGAPHGRERMFWVADADRDRCERLKEPNFKAYKDQLEASRRGNAHRRREDVWSTAVAMVGHDERVRRVEFGIQPLAHGIPCNMERLRAYGNAIVPQVAAQFIGAYIDTIGATP